MGLIVADYDGRFPNGVVHPYWPTAVLGDDCVVCGRGWDHDHLCGAFGWPQAIMRVGELGFRPERFQMCPACLSVNCAMTVEPATGPGGRWRMGDPAVGALSCLDCGNKATRS